MKKLMFELSRVYDSGEQEPPQIVPLSEVVENAKMKRRGFLQVGLSVSAALALLDSCGVKNLSSTNFESPCDGFAHDGSVTALAISKDGKMLLSAGEDNIIKVWQLPDGALMKTISDVPATSSLSISPKGNMFATLGGQNSIQLRRLPDGELIKNLEGHSIFVNAVKFSSDGKFLISGSSDDSVILWNVAGENQYEYKKIMRHKDSVHAIAISPDNSIWASGSYDTTIIVGDFEGNVTKILSGNNSAIVSLEFSADGRYLASVSRDNTIIIWDLENEEIIKKMNTDKAKSGYSHSLSFKKMLVCKSNENEISLWSILFFKLINKIKSKVNVFSVTPDEKLLVAGNKNKTIQLWSLPDGILLKCLLDLKSSPSSVKGITYTTTNEYGQLITYTLPCGSPIPAGARCVCNCVPGSSCSCNNYCSCNKVCTCQSVNQRTYCSCNQVCTCLSVNRGTYCSCNRVCTCLAVRM